VCVYATMYVCGWWVVGGGGHGCSVIILLLLLYLHPVLSLSRLCFLVTTKPPAERWAEELLLVVADMVVLEFGAVGAMGPNMTFQTYIG